VLMRLHVAFSLARVVPFTHCFCVEFNQVVGPAVPITLRGSHFASWGLLWPYFSAWMPLGLLYFVGAVLARFYLSSEATPAGKRAS
jgi:hypothetical protein